MRGLTLLGLMGAFVQLVGCDALNACNDGGCGPTLDVTLTSAAWTPGEYTVELVPEDPGRKTVRCTLTLPLSEAAGGADCSGPGMVFGMDELSLWYWDSGPVPAQLSVTRDGETLFDERINPSYEESFPYGEDCGGCESAELTVTLP